MKLLLVVPAVFSMQVTEDNSAALNMKHDIEGMKELFLGISKSKIDVATRDAVEEMMRQIRENLQKAIDAEAKVHQDNLQCKFDSIGNCSDARTDDLVNEEGNHEEANTQGSTHRDCRVAEDGLARLTKATKIDCDNKAKRFTRCRRTVEKFRQEHHDGGSAAEVKVWMDCIHSQISNAKALLATQEKLEEECDAQCDKRKTCNQQQSGFELQRCNWQADVDTQCLKYEKCYVSAVDEYYNAKKEAHEAWEISKDQKQALCCLECYGQSILENKTDLSHCDGELPTCVLPPNPCPEHCPDVEAPVRCRERERKPENDWEFIPRPCEPEFVQEEYTAHYMSSTDPSVCAPHAECKPCHKGGAPVPMSLLGAFRCVGGPEDVLASLEGKTPHGCKAECAADELCEYASFQNGNCDLMKGIATGKTGGPGQCWKKSPYQG